MMELQKVDRMWLRSNHNDQVIKGSNHTFCGKNLFNNFQLPYNTIIMVSQAIDFLNSFSVYQN